MAKPRDRRPCPQRRVAALAAVAACVVVAGACTAETADGGGGESAAPAVAGGGGAGDERAEVTIGREIDGDSLELAIDGESVEVRLIGINAPELADCQGAAAGEALGALLRAGTIAVTGSETDRFGRLLVDLDVDGASVNEAMVRSGWALAIHGDGDAHVDAMRAAADDAVGIWGPAAAGCDAVDGDVVVLDAEPDPPGPDDENLDQEFVVIANAGVEPIDLGGWQVRDESTGNRFVFDERVLGPGDELVLVTGCGRDTERAVFWCSDSPVWSNGGDTVLVLAPDGAVAAHRFLE